MKFIFKALFAGMLLSAGIAVDCLAQNVGLYAGGYIRRERPGTIETLRNSGFQYVVLFNINVESDGTLKCDGETVCQNGSYVYGQTNPEYVNDIKKLKQAPTAITRIEICIGGWGNESYNHIKDLIRANGTGSNTILYRNFKALKDAIPVIDAVNNDDEHCYDADSAEKFHKMMNQLGYKTTLAPYTNKTFWQKLASGLGSGICDRIMVQCYDGGAGNNPKDWHLLDGVTVHGGRYHYQDDSLDAAHHAAKFQEWKNDGTSGGFFWVFNDNSWNTNQYAARAHRVFGVKSSSDTRATIYADANYSGYSVSLGEGSYSQSELALYGFIGGDLTSLKVTPGWRVTLYANADFTGDSRSYTSDINNVGDFNDKTRSIKIEAFGKQGLSGNYKIRNRNSGKYLDTDNNSTDNNTAIIQYDNEGDDASQTWALTDIGNGVYKICAYSNQGRGFDVRDAKKDNSTQVQIYDYNGNRNQQFILYDKGDGYYQIIDRNSGKAVEMPGSSTVNGDWIKIWDNNGSDTQQWALEENRCTGAAVVTVYADDQFRGHSMSLSEGDYSLERLKRYNIGNDEITSIKVAAGFKVILYDNDNFGGTQMEYTSDNSNLSGFNDKTSSLKIMAWGKSGMSGNFKIRNRESGMYLDPADNRTDNDTPIMQYNNEGDDPSQTWTFRELGDGVYRIGEFSAPDQGFDVADASTDNGTQVKIYKYSGGRNQQFIVYDMGNGYYQLIDRNSAKPVEIPKSSHTLGEWAKIYDNNGTNTQQWAIEENHISGEAIATIYRDANYQSKSVTLAEGDYDTSRLNRYNFKDNDLSALKVTPGFKVILYDGDNFTGDNRQITEDTSYVGAEWNDKTSSLRVVPNGTPGLSGDFFLCNRNSGLFLDLENNSTENGTHVIQYDCEEDSSQIWTLKEVEEGVYTIASSINASQVLDVKDAATGNGAEIQVYEHSGAPHQQFILYSKGDNYQLVARHCGRVVEIPKSSFDPGTWAALYSNNGTDTQQWNLINPSSVGTSVDVMPVSGASLSFCDRTITATGLAGLRLDIHDFAGCRIYSTSILSQSEKIGLESLAPGLYVAVVGNKSLKIRLN